MLNQIILGKRKEKLIKSRGKHTKTNIYEKKESFLTFLR